MKLIYLFLFACIFASLLPDAAFASVETAPGFGEVDYEDSKTTYELICDLRKMFCGGTAIAIVSFVVITIGFLIFRGKLNWGFMLVLLTGVFIFVGASQITEIIARPPPGIGVVQACDC